MRKKSDTMTKNEVRELTPVEIQAIAGGTNWGHVGSTINQVNHTVGAAVLVGMFPIAIFMS